MNYLNELNKIMESQSKMALATSIDGNPNVRIVNFYYDPNKGGVIYFSTFKDNEKVNEFLKNDNVAFTTAPEEKNSHVRSKKAKVIKSNLSICDLKKKFIKKIEGIEGYSDLIDQAGEMLQVYEIHFSEANAVVSPESGGIVKF